uniref:Uncharacterized protein n=1 Tax=Aegilops tauschii subsp. strangulata TaxID=200361 RepID=A0A452Y766_AEGTS
MTKTMPRDSSASGALVPSDSAAMAAAATAAAGKLPFPLLTRTNYAAWAMRMKYLLHANGAWAAVDREASSTEVDKAKEEMAMTIISQSIDDTTLLRVAEKETAADVWAALRSMHVGVERVREARIQSLRLEFDGLKMGDAESVDDFAARFTTLVGRIRELGDAMEEKYVVKKLLRAVSNKFIHVASSIALFGDTNKMAMEEAIGSLKAHEKLVKGRETGREEEQLLMARGQDSSRGRGRGRGRARGGGRKHKSEVECYNCH